MTRTKILSVALCLVLCVCWVVSADESTDITVPIMVSPSALVMGSEGVWVTVHAEIPYSSVVGMSVTLNGKPVKFTKADNRGELVAKFEIDVIKGIVAPPSAVLVLKGTTTSGATFSGTDTIRVIGATGKK